MQSSTFKRSAIALAVVGAFAAGSVIAGAPPPSRRRVPRRRSPPPTPCRARHRRAARLQPAGLAARTGGSPDHRHARGAQGIDARRTRHGRGPDPAAVPSLLQHARAAEPDAVDGHGLGLHCRCQRSDRHQCARGRRRRRGAGPPDRQARVQGEGAGQGQDDRHRRRQDRRDWAADRQDRQSGSDEGR